MVTDPVPGLTVTSENLSVPARGYCVPSSRSRLAIAPFESFLIFPAEIFSWSLSRFALDWVTSTYMGSSFWIVARAVGWLAVTSDPVVTTERPMRPEMGALTRVWARLIRAVSRAAFAPSTSASACRSAASASSASWRLTALIATSSLYRSAFSRLGTTFASARDRAAFALACAAS